MFENKLPVQSDEQAKPVDTSYAIEVSKGTEIVGQYIITVKDYFEQGYAARVANGEIEVFDVMPAPGPDASPSENAAWEYIIATYGNGTLIRKAEKLDEGYYLIGDTENGGMGVSGDYKLVVSTKSK